MAKRLKVGDRVSWNSEAGRVSGTIVRVREHDVDYKGHTHHASPQTPQYEIKSSKTDHVAMHLGAALTRLRGKARREGPAGRPRGKQP
jgi:hypothetical protein